MGAEDDCNEKEVSMAIYDNTSSITILITCSYHALKDESFIRQSLRRQSAALHHATVGYAVKSYFFIVTDALHVL